MRDSDNNLQLIFFFAISLGLFSVGLTGIGSEIQSGINKATNETLLGVTQLFRSVDSYASLFTSLQEVRDENLRYQNRVAELETELNKQQELIDENKWLRSQLVLELPREEQGSLAKVLKYEYSPSIGYVYTTVSPEVKVGDLATVYDYIVGQVVEIKADTARVRLLAANDSNLLVRIGTQSVIGKLKGNGGISLNVDEVQANSEVGVGDEIKLLNPIGPYAAGYELGKVLEIEGNPADPLWSVKVDFPIDLFKIDYMIIIPNHE